MRSRRLVIPLLLAPGLIACAEGETPDGDACRVAPIAEGFGARGPHAVEARTVPHPSIPSSQVSVFLPSASEPAGSEGAAAPDAFPVVLLAHAHSEDAPRRYRALIQHLVSRGHGVVFPPHSIDSQRHVDRLDALDAGFVAGVEAAGDRLDRQRVGFIGHSYGAGALPVLAHRVLSRGWGGKGAFLLLMAPWFAIEVGGEELASFPPHLKLLLLVFEEDTANDHRIAIDLLDAIAAPPDAKDYLVVGSDRHGACELPAVHTVPLSEGLRARDDALDDYAIFRLTDALAAYAFRGDPAGRRVALGKGSDAQVRMGTWADGTPMRPLVWRSRPEPSHPQEYYLFRFDDRQKWLRFGEPAG